MFRMGGYNLDYIQLSIFDSAETFSMYDGYEIINTTKILTDCGIQELIAGQVAHLDIKHMDGYYSICIPNEYGGSYGFRVNENQFKSHFRYLSKKVYPKKKEIWNGRSWIENPEFIS